MGLWRSWERVSLAVKRSWVRPPLAPPSLMRWYGLMVRHSVVCGDDEGSTPTSSTKFAGVVQRQNTGLPVRRHGFKSRHSLQVLVMWSNWLGYSTVYGEGAGSSPVITAKFSGT